MKKIKALIAVLLSVTMCGILALATACGANGDDAGNGNIVSTGELKKDENGKVIFDDVTIKLETVVAGDDWAKFQDIINIFNREYDGQIYVNAHCTSDGLFETQVADRISNNNNPPDFIMSHGKYHKNFAEKNLIQPMNETMELSGITVDFSKYSQGLIQYRTLGTDSSIYSLAADAQSIVVLYNKELLSELGFEEAPTDRTALLDVCKKFKEQKNGAAIAWQDNDNNNDNFSEYSFCTAVLQNGGTLVNSEGKVDWYSNESNRKAFQDAISAYRELYNNGYATRNLGGGFGNFLNKKCIFYFAAPWHVEGLVQQVANNKGVTIEEAAEKYVGGVSTAKWFAMGENANKVCANYIYGDSHMFAMTRSVSDINKKAAILEFFNWFTTTEEIGVRWAKAGHISSCSVVTNSQAYKSDVFVSEYISNFYPNVDYFQCLPLTSVAEEFKKTIKSLYAATVLTTDYSEESDLTVIRNREQELNYSTGFFE